MPTIYTAIFGPHDDLKEPLIITPGWDYVCYTDQDFKSSTWEIRKINTTGLDTRILAREFKIKFFLHIKDLISIWIDGSFRINCNLTDWWKQNHHPLKPMVCIKHPIHTCIYEEADVCIRYGRGNAVDIIRQINEYKHIVPKDNGVIQSGILMRERTDLCELMCREWWHEVQRYSNRDQIAFGKIAALYPQSINYITWDYRTGKEFIFKSHNRKS